MTKEYLHMTLSNPVPDMAADVPTYLLTTKSLSLFMDGKAHSIARSDDLYAKALVFIRDQDWDGLRALLNPTAAIEMAIADAKVGNITVKDGALFYMGKELDNYMAKRALEIARENLPFLPLLKFIDRTMKNPSYRAVNELFGFLEAGDLPITPEGKFLAFKRVRDNYTDVHSGTMDNSIGNVVSMPRNEVDDNSRNTCSAGLHFCSRGYLDHFRGARTVVVEIDPEDVVSIPTDYSHTKGRCCKYKVIGEIDDNGDPLTNRKIVEPSEFDIESTDEFADDEFTGFDESD